MIVCKRHKRLVIESAAGELIYCPPDFLCATRSRLEHLARAMAERGRDIDLIMEFETRWNPRRAVLPA